MHVGVWHQRHTVSWVVHSLRRNVGHLVDRLGARRIAENGMVAWLGWVFTHFLGVELNGLGELCLEMRVCSEGGSFSIQYGRDLHDLPQQAGIKSRTRWLRVAETQLSRLKWKVVRSR
jgi:hypothetical protein